MRPALTECSIGRAKIAFRRSVCNTYGPIDTRLLHFNALFQMVRVASARVIDTAWNADYLEKVFVKRRFTFVKQCFGILKRGFTSRKVGGYSQQSMKWCFSLQAFEKYNLISVSFFAHFFVSLAVAQDTSVRKRKEKQVFLLLFAHLIVSLSLSCMSQLQNYPKNTK